MKNNSLFWSTFVLAVLALISIFIAHGKGKHLQGLDVSKNLIIQTLPLLIFAFILAGMLQVIIPKDLIQNWIGSNSGNKGIIVGSIIGGLLPGGPYITLPVALGMLKAGASLPVLVSMITGWSLIAIMRLPMEIGIMGLKFTLLRLASTFLLAPLAGYLAMFLMKIFNIR